MISIIPVEVHDLTLCPCCCQPKRIYWLHNENGLPDSQHAECVNPTCDLYMVTLGLGEHERLTKAQIRGYGRARRRQLRRDQRLARRLS